MAPLFDADTIRTAAAPASWRVFAARASSAVLDMTSRHVGFSP